MGTTRWAILTGEYPPQPGGVSDYTRLVARELVAAGDAVTVYAPRVHAGNEADDVGIIVRRLPDHFGPRGLAYLDRALSHRPRPDRILIQYVPHAFGWKGMNVAFAAWVAFRKRLAPVWVMFHEVVFPLPWRPASHAILGVVTRATARLIAGAADRVFVSVPAWGEVVRKVCPRARPAEWLPVPSNVAATADATEVAAIRAKYAAPGGLLVGHFGTFGALIAGLLAPAAARVLRDHPAVRLLLIGRGSERFCEQFATAHPDLAARVATTGELPPDSIPAHLRACDLLLQPFPDGISSRRTSVMAGLANGVPVVTNLGELSEPFWTQIDCVALGLDALQRLLADPAARAELGRRGQDAYRSHFSVNRIIGRLR